MIGYILIGIGAWLVLDDWKIARAKKSNHAKDVTSKDKGGQDDLHENGNDSSGSNSAGKPGAIHQKPDRNRSIKVPVKKEKGVKVHDISKKPVHKVKPDQDRNSAGDNSTGQPDATPVSDQGKSLKNTKSNHAKDVTSKDKGGQDAGSKNNYENDARDNGDNVGAESSGRDESDGTEIDQRGGGSAGD